MTQHHDARPPTPSTPTPIHPALLRHLRPHPLSCSTGSMSLQSLVLVPPSVKQDLHFLVVTVHQVGSGEQRFVQRLNLMEPGRHVC